MRQEDSIRLVVPRDLADPAEGQVLLDVLECAAPSFMPAVFSNLEPIRIPYGGQPAAEIWSEPFLWKAADRRIAGGVHAGGFRRSGHSSVSIDDGARTDQDILVMVLQQLSSAWHPTFGCLHRINPLEFDPDGHGAIFANPGRLHLLMSIYSLADTIPELFWGTVFGERYVEQFGLDRLLSAPAYRVIQLGEQCVYLQLSPNIADMETRFPAIRIAREAVKEHLGTDAFFSR